MLELVEALAAGLLVPTGRGRGRQFRLLYSWGHPEFTVGDPEETRGHVTVTKEGLEYTRGRSDDLIFRIPRDLIHSASHTDDVQVIVVVGLGGQSLEIGFRPYGAKTDKEAQRFVAAVRAKLKS